MGYLVERDGRVGHVDLKLRERFGLELERSVNGCGWRENA